ncbi:MAG: sigma-70 family RNA polymerase sigma factor [bacterium]
MTIDATNNSLQEQDSVVGTDPTPEILNRWLEDARTGMTAFDNLYDYYFPKIYNYVYYRVGNREHAEDMTSEVFIKVISRFETFSGDCQAFTGWIYRIAGNSITDYYRLGQRKTQVHYVDETDLIGLVDSSATEVEVNFIDAIDKERLMSEVRESINTLPAIEQEIITLKFFEGLDNKTIAEVMNMKQGNFNVRLHRTVEKLKTLLGGKMGTVHHV